jgi:DNA primase large subunit
MQRANVRFEDTDCSKYPFLKKTAERVRETQLTIEELVSSQNPQVFDRAKERVENAILTLELGKRKKDNIEIPSFPGALVLVIATKNSWIKKRYALAEAKNAYVEMLQEKSNEKILTIAQDFDWKINEGKPYKDFRLGFTFYLRNAAHLHGYEWKLVNQIIDKGMVYLNRDKVARLLQEEVKRRIEKRLDIPDLKNLPEYITIIANNLTKLAQDIMGQEIEEMPKTVVQGAFPPCINMLYEDAAKSHHLSHIGRFTLTSFLINIGMSPEALNELFKTFSDYNERLTRYQIEHIAGERGSATRYTCPQCSVLQTHGVCRSKDDLCSRIYHPLAYYKRKLKRA